MHTYIHTYICSIKFAQNMYHATRQGVGAPIFLIPGGSGSLKVVGGLLGGSPRLNRMMDGGFDFFFFLTTMVK